ncbi:unnamed protein product [Periconia digitata]|uniref:Uncharacterized protein n=1 Tax=Periconia digitata TaxID=1303443 RepID=A0A9W4UXC0_9PLEO|nr:unnamed protein product [Periconia digitata]
MPTYVPRYLHCSVPKYLLTPRGNSCYLLAIKSCTSIADFPVRRSVSYLCFSPFLLPSSRTLSLSLSLSLFRVHSLAVASLALSLPKHSVIQ